MGRWRTPYPHALSTDERVAALRRYVMEQIRDLEAVTL